MIYPLSKIKIMVFLTVYRQSVVGISVLRIALRFSLQSNDDRVSSEFLSCVALAFASPNPTPAANLA
jgi:hypothetical protein